MAGQEQNTGGDQLARMPSFFEDYGFDPNGLRATCSDICGLLLAVEGQNTRYFGALADKRLQADAEIAHLVIGAIVTEQALTVTSLAEVADASGIYDELYTVGDMLEDDIALQGTAVADLNKTHSDFEDELTQKRDETDKAINDDPILAAAQSYAPQVSDEVAGILRERALNTVRDLEDIVKLSHEDLESAREQLALLHDRLATFGEFLNTSPISVWPLPYAMLGLKELAETSSTVVRVVDQLPLDPHLANREEMRARVRAGFEIDQPDASDKIIEYFVGHVGETVSIDDLISHLYDDETQQTRGVRVLRSRISTPLGPVLGWVPARLRDEHGLVLQYGLRKPILRAADGKIKQGPASRIYRVLDYDTMHAIAMGDSRSAPPSLVSTEAHQDVFTDNADLRDQMAKVMGVRVTKAEVKIVKPGASIDKIDADQLARFGTEVDQTLSILEDMMLLESPNVKIVDMKRQDPTGLLGAKDTIQAMIEAGYMKQFKDKEWTKILNQHATTLEMAIMLLIRTNAELLGDNAPLREQAIKILKDRIKARFEQLA